MEKNFFVYIFVILLAQVSLDFEWDPPDFTSWGLGSKAQGTTHSLGNEFNLVSGFQSVPALHYPWPWGGPWDYSEFQFAPLFVEEGKMGPRALPSSGIYNSLPILSFLFAPHVPWEGNEVQWLQTGQSEREKYKGKGSNAKMRTWA